jgi:OOP family OmpA-OmpF porin
VNLALSQERARKVARFLVDVGGVEARRVTAQGFGETRPVASNDTKEGRAANRRVEILIINE